MGASIVILFLIWLLQAGAVGIVCGIIGLVVVGKKRRAGTPVPNVLNVIFSIVLSMGIAIIMIPAVFFSYIVVENVVDGIVPPEDFVQTDIEIDEIGFQEKRFTANGVVYEVLDLSLTYETDVEEQPVFTYKEDGLFGASQYGNYYSVKNSQGFDLVSDGCGTLFCPVTEKERVIEYYTDISRCNAYYDDWDGRYYRLTDGEKQSVSELLDTDTKELPQKTVVLEEADEFEISFISEDRFIYVKDYSFLVLDGELYCVSEYEYEDDYNCKYTMNKLPDKIAQALLAIHDKN